MKRTLDYFKTFLDEPETLDDVEFKRKLKQWMNFYKANRKTFDFTTDEMQDRLEVMIENFKIRFKRTPEIEEKWEKLYALTETFEKDADYSVKTSKLLLAFMEEYQWHFGFTPKQIAEQKKHLRESEKIYARLLESERKLEESKIIEEDSIKELDDKLAAYVEQTGKTPVLTALSAKKKHTGN